MKKTGGRKSRDTLPFKMDSIFILFPTTANYNSRDASPLNYLKQIVTNLKTNAKFIS